MSKITPPVIACIIFITLFAILLSVFRPNILPSEYIASVNVDKPEKIEHTLTNMVNDVTSRKFIVSKISVEYFPLGNSYKISVGGVTPSKLLTFGD